MKVFYDARWILVDDRFDGVSRYSHELAWALHQRPDMQLTWIVHDKRQLEKLPPADHLLVNDPSDIRAELHLAQKLNRAGAEIVYSPFFVMGTRGKNYKLILTIHDMIYFTHRTPPQWLPWHVRLGWRLFHLTHWPMRWQLNQADHVVTVSQTARQELMAARATNRPITTVANAVSDTFVAPDSDHASKQTVVYMGSFTPYKNVERLIEATAYVPDVTLHLLGKLPSRRRPAIEAYIRQNGVSDRVVLHDGVTDDQYRNALRDARCAISASRVEGFGLPLIEAQQAGVPFVAADTPIFHEIGAQSVRYFDPNNAHEAARHIRALADPDMSRDFIARGRANAARYTWHASAAVAAEVLTQVAIDHARAE